MTSYPKKYCPARKQRLFPRLCLWQQKALSAWLFFLPLVFWPDLENPFSTPKLLWMVGGALVSLAIIFLHRTENRRLTEDGLFWGIMAASIAVSLSILLSPRPSAEELLLRLSPPFLYLALRLIDVHPRHIVQPLLWSTLALSTIALLQFLTLDPFRWLGLHPEVFGSPRMRVYSTFGNPNFLAAWLAAMLPFCTSMRSVPESRNALLAWLEPMAILLPLGALLATGSRTFLVVLPLLLLGAVLTLGLRKAGVIAAAFLTGALFLLLFPQARSWKTTLEGRLYIDRVIMRHFSEIPWFGYGPGSFSDRFQLWQAVDGRTPGLDPRGRRYAGPLDHAHNDYLEFLVDYGLVGLIALAVLLFSLFRDFWRLRWKGGNNAWYNKEAFISLGILLLVALFDFPFHRVPEWGLFWILLSLPSREIPPGTAGDPIVEM